MFLDWREICHMLILSKSLHKDFIHNELIYSKLCDRFCRNEEIPLGIVSDYLKQVDEREVNKYWVILKRLCNDHGYVWDVDYDYCYNQKGKDAYQIIDKKMLQVKDKPGHGEFVTLKSKKLLEAGKFYRWQFKIDHYDPNIDNSFRIMVGFESVNFFPFKKQSSGDVIGWQGKSKGCALIVGTGEIVRSACGNHFEKPTKKENILPFKNDDVIICELNLTQRDPNEARRGIYGNSTIAPLSCTSDLQGRKYNDMPSTSETSGKCRFILVRNGEKTELCDWIEAADMRFAPYAPAVSVNRNQTITLSSVKDY